MKYHGGFKTGEEVELYFTSNHERKHWSTKYVIMDFFLMKVQLQHKDKPAPLFWVSVLQIRKPNIRIGERG